MSRGSWLTMPWREISCKQELSQVYLNVLPSAADIHKIKLLQRRNDT